MGLLGKFSANVAFEYDKVIMTKNNAFFKKGHFNHGLFVLIIFEFTNYNNASSSAYIFDSCDIWHARPGYVSMHCLKLLNTSGVISNIRFSTFEKCSIHVESNQTRKPFTSIHRESKLLSLVHFDLGDLKNIMTRGGKMYYITFIYKSVFKNSKDDPFGKFVLYKNEVENQLNIKD